MVVTGELRGSVRAGLAAVALALCAGCVGPGSRIRSALKAPPTAPSPEPAASYTLSCPDAIDVNFASSPNLSGRYAIAADGTIEIANVGRVIVEGQTSAAAAIRLAKASGTTSQNVHVAVAEHKSRQIFVFGPTGEQKRAVPFQGPESVIDFLRRTGGLSTRANHVDVHVVRPHVAAGRRPEVFNVDLEAILIKSDNSSNVLLQPYDHVYLGATRRSVYAHYLPGGEWTEKPVPR